MRKVHAGGPFQKKVERASAIERGRARVLIQLCRLDRPDCYAWSVHPVTETHILTVWWGMHSVAIPLAPGLLEWADARDDVREAIRDKVLAVLQCRHPSVKDQLRLAVLAAEDDLEKLECRDYRFGGGGFGRGAPYRELPDDPKALACFACETLRHCYRYDLQERKWAIMRKGR